MKKILLILALLILIAPTYAAVDAALSMEAMQAQQEGNLTKQHIVAQKIISKIQKIHSDIQLKQIFFLRLKNIKTQFSIIQKRLMP